jgi:hypothetical protein
MASSEVQMPSTGTGTTGPSGRKPRGLAAQPTQLQQQQREPTQALDAAPQRQPLRIPLRRSGSQPPQEAADAGAGAAAGPSSRQAAADAGGAPVSSRQQQQQGAAAPAQQQGAAAPAQQPQQPQPQQRRRQQQRSAPPPDSDVIVIGDGDSSSDDDDVVITDYKPGKRPRASPQQQQQRQQQQHPAGGQAVERGLHGGHFIMPSWQAAAPREASPEPAFRCLICLDGIKPDNMATTPCGCVWTGALGRCAVCTRRVPAAARPSVSCVQQPQTDHARRLSFADELMLMRLHLTQAHVLLRLHH